MSGCEGVGSSWAGCEGSGSDSCCLGSGLGKGCDDGGSVPG